MATTLSVRPSRAILGGDPFCPTRTRPRRVDAPALINILKSHRYTWGHRHILATAVRAGSRADDSAPFEMSVENALKVLGVSEGASFDDILRAKNSILATCKDDQETIAQVLISINLQLSSYLYARGDYFHFFFRKFRIGLHGSSFFFFNYFLLKGHFQN